MRAVVLRESQGSLQVEEVPDPVAHGEEQVIDVLGCGVCHSDLHAVSGEYPVNLPVILGHEVVGVHPDLGPVMVYAPWGCRQPSCPQCSAGLEMICPNSHEAGLIDDGGYAEKMKVPSISYLAPLGALDPVQAAPLACGGLTAFRAVSKALPRLEGAGRRALVIGAGGLGQYAIQFLRVQSQAEVAVLDTSADKREQALRLGAQTAYAPGELEGTFDAIIDFVGAQQTMDAMVGHIGRQGVGVVVGLFGGRIPFGLGAVPNEASFTTSIWGSRAQLTELIDFATAHPLTTPIETLPLDQAQEAHRRLAAGEVAGRVVLTPR